ncbi:16S rRNA (adenine(1518)-N(6)/adenine(1519)-N(6))-dimethyltransferase RsmA [Candidatus Methylocalor cossyra]|uniref:Ribosomal RNA small subunit methyltransferase A n=1 Tax=Candidatus Methylocalor cossyra TaxID=3108543 RepID=A0ABM9NIY9_9GAMM
MTPIHRHTPRKRFGQHFLQDAAVIQRILETLAPSDADWWVEIGPGEGVLTAALLRRCRRLDAVEIDRDLVASLTRRFAGETRLRLHQADALKFDFRALAGGERLRLVGNLPYNISTPLLFHLFRQADAIRDLHVMLQKEVADRLAAGPRDPGYGRLSVMAQYHGRVEKLFEVPAEAFHPRPKVVSAMVRVVPHGKPVVEAGREDLERVVALAFSQRRKTLRNSVRSLFEEQDLRRLGLDPEARAETLSLDDYARLALCLAEQRARR